MSQISKNFLILSLIILCSTLSLIAGQSRSTRRPRPPRRRFVDSDIEAYHFHTYFYDQNPSSIKEAMDFRKATRYQINTGFLHECSLNQVIAGVEGPHPYAQYELCCNKTSFAEATAWHMQNHGNLSVLIHPLTREDLADHAGRATWMGHAIPLDLDCGGCLVELLPEARICPIYPFYPDRIPRAGFRYTPLKGTEDYSHHQPGNQTIYIWKLNHNNSTTSKPEEERSSTMGSIQYIREIGELLQNSVDDTSIRST